MLPTRWVKISTYLQSEPFLSITFILINLNLLILYNIMGIRPHLTTSCTVFRYLRRRSDWQFVYLQSHTIISSAVSHLHAYNLTL
jgi:hypothetical protein